MKAHYNDFEWTAPDELEELAGGQKLWPHYLKTAVYLDGTELRGTVRPVREHGEKAPPMGSLHVLAAVQPWAEPDSEESRARTFVLIETLKMDGIESIRAIGSSFDGNYQEESRAVFGLNDDEARELGRKFGQIAIFSWEGADWSLLASVGEKQSRRPWRWTPTDAN
jgi:hypothetical protein